MNHLSQRSSWGHGAARFYAQDGIVLFAAALLAGWWIARRIGPPKVALVVWAGLSALVGLALNQGIGHLVQRARPYTTHQHVLVLVSRTHDFSFPSDHAVVAAAVTVGLWLISRRLGLAVGLAAVVLCFARVYVGAHYPGDVSAGLVVGGAVAAAGAPLAVRVLAPVMTRLGRTPLRFLVAVA